MEDQEIIELYFARDEAAIRETAEKYGALCLRLAENTLGSREDAEECVNQTYLNLWNTIPPTRPVNFTAFVCKVTRNLALKQLEAMTAAKRAGGAMLSLSELEALLPDGRFSPDLEEAEIGRYISAFLQGEKEVARKVFVRKYFFFDSVAEIAARYRFSESKVKSMLFHTRARLKAYLQKEGIEL